MVGRLHLEGKCAYEYRAKHGGVPSEESAAKSISDLVLEAGDEVWTYL